MKNGIVNKLTSLILMTIMVAGGMTFAIPGVVPEAEAAHNANLFVSAENTAFDNYFNGPMVIEVVVNDPTISDTDESKGEPDVTVNGKDIRMVQATDGNWYGYFADLTQAQRADETVSARGFAGFGLDFGKFCGNGTSGNVLVDDISQADIIFTDTEAIAIPRSAAGTASGVDGQTAIVDCNEVATPADGNGITNAEPLDNHVVREFKTPTPENLNLVERGQINIDVDAWPFIQLYTFDPTGNVIVQYNKGGGAQSTTLTFDTVSGVAGIALDRVNFPQDAQVHVTITDPMLNIDPTDEDSWTFDTTRGATAIHYQAFNENGEADGACVVAANTAVIDAACDAAAEAHFD